MCSCGKNPNVAMCADCPPGEPGERGQSMAIRATVEAPGVNCIYGGFKIEFGIDNDPPDGIPDTILQTIYVCNARPGMDGSNVTFITGTITTLSPGSSATASVVATGTPNQYRIDMGIPAGAAGATPTFVTGTITTVAAGSPATASIVATGTPNQYQINMGIPTGATGAAPAAADIPIDGISVPSCLAAVVGSGDSLLAHLQAVENAICSLSSGSLAANTFKATKNVVQSIVFAGAGTIFDDIYFADDYTPGNYDNGNNFSISRFVAPATVTRTFIQENLRIKISAVGWANVSNTVVLEIVKNVGGVITVLATSGAAITYNTVDVFGNAAGSANGYNFNAFGTGPVTINATEQVYVRLKIASITAEGLDILTLGKFYCY